MAWFQQVLSTLKCHGRGQAFRDFLNVGGRMKKVFSLDCQTCCFSLESDGVTTVIDALFSIFPVRGIICVQTGSSGSRSVRQSAGFPRVFLGRKLHPHGS